MKEKIIECAIFLADKNGVKFTLDDIAVTMRISKKTIYKYFAGKEELLCAMINYIFDDIHKQHDEILKLEISDVQKLKRIVCAYPRIIHFSASDMEKLAQLHPNVYALIEENLSTNWELTFEVFDRCVEQGSIKNISKKCFKTVVLGIFEQLLKEENPEKLTKECISAVFSGFEK